MRIIGSTVSNPHPRTREERESQREFMVRRWQDPEYRERMLEMLRRPRGTYSTFIYERIVEYLDAFHREHGYAPTVRELARHLDLSVATTYEHLGGARDAGLVVWEPGMPRTLRSA